MSYTKEDIIRIVKEEDVKFIRLQFTDIFGQLKNVAITASQIEKAVNNQIMPPTSVKRGVERVSCSMEDRLGALLSFSLGGPVRARWRGSSATCTTQTAPPL